jgi:hypothetical protein
MATYDFLAMGVMLLRPAREARPRCASRCGPSCCTGAEKLPKYSAGGRRESVFYSLIFMILLEVSLFFFVSFATIIAIPPLVVINIIFP